MSERMRNDAMRVVWNRAIAQKNVATLDALTKGWFVHQKPRGKVTNQPPNQQRAWQKRKNLYDANRAKAEQVVMNQRQVMHVLRTSKNPNDIAYAIKRGANVRALTSSEVKKRMEALEDPRKVDGSLVILTAIVNAGLDHTPWARDEYREFRVNSDFRTRMTLNGFIDDIFDSIEETGVRPGHLDLFRALARHTDLGELFRSKLIDCRINVEWETYMKVVRAMIPTDPARRHRYLHHIAKAGLEGCSEPEPDLLDIVRLDASLLRWFLVDSGWVGHWDFKQDFIHKLGMVAPYFRRDGVRLSRAQKLIRAIREVDAATVRELERHGLLEPVKPAPRPAAKRAPRRSPSSAAPRPAKRRRTTRR